MFDHFICYGSTLDRHVNDPLLQTPLQTWILGFREPLAVIVQHKLVGEQFGLELQHVVDGAPADTLLEYLREVVGQPLLRIVGIVLMEQDDLTLLVQRPVRSRSFGGTWSVSSSRSVSLL